MGQEAPRLDYVDFLTTTADDWFTHRRRAELAHKGYRWICLNYNLAVRNHIVEAILYYGEQADRLSKVLLDDRMADHPKSVTLRHIPPGAPIEYCIPTTPGTERWPTQQRPW